MLMLRAGQTFLVVRHQCQTFLYATPANVGFILEKKLDPNDSFVFSMAKQKDVFHFVEVIILVQKTSSLIPAASGKSRFAPRKLLCARKAFSEKAMKFSKNTHLLRTLAKVERTIL